MFQSKRDGEENLPFPKDISQLVGQHIVVKMGKNPDWIWSLKAAVKPRGENGKASDVRIFDPKKIDGQRVKSKDYNSFAEHPELIFFEGWFNKETYEIEIAEKSKTSS